MLNRIKYAILEKLFNEFFGNKRLVVINSRGFQATNVTFWFLCNMLNSQDKTAYIIRNKEYKLENGETVSNLVVELGK